MTTTAVRLKSPTPTKRDLRVATGLRQLRLLTARQVGELWFPDHALHAGGTGHYTVSDKVLASLSRLTRAGYTNRVSVRGSNAHAWYLSKKGWEMTKGLADNRPYRLLPEKADGNAQLHTLAVNDVGLSFIRAARRRGDQCGPHDITHEVGHPIAADRSNRKVRLVTPDALIRYEMWEEPNGIDQNGSEQGRGVSELSVSADGRHGELLGGSVGIGGSELLAVPVARDGGRVEVVRWFLEVERDKKSLDVLMRKLEDYYSLAHYRRPGHDVPAWEERYPRFPEPLLPEVLLVISGHQDRTSEGRLRSVLAEARTRPILREQDPLIWFATIEDVRDKGPFSPVWQTVLDGDRRSL